MDAASKVPVRCNWNRKLYQPQDWRLIPVRLLLIPGVVCPARRAIDAGFIPLHANENQRGEKGLLEIARVSRWVNASESRVDVSFRGPAGESEAGNS